MSFNNKITLVFYSLTFLVLSNIITCIHAHGGVDDEAGPPVKAPSVFANEKQSTLAQGNVGLAFGLTAMAALASALGSVTPFLDFLFPYIPFLAHIKITESKGFLAGSLSFASGILIALTLGDLFPEAITSFNNSQLFNRIYSSLVATSIFIFTSLLIIITKLLIKKYKKQNAIDIKMETFDQNESPTSEIKEAKVNGKNEAESRDLSLSRTEIIVEENSVENHANFVDSEHAKRFKSLSIQIATALAFQ